MKQATADLLVKNKSVILQKWVDSIRENNAVRATIPSASLAQVVEELYLYVLESFRQDKNAIKHFDRVLTLVQKPVLPETRFGLQVLLNHGKRKMFDLLEESLPAGGDLARVFRAIDACFDDISLHVVSECEKSQVTEDDGAAHAGEDELTPHSRLNLFYSAFLNSTDAIIITNLHGKITEANTAFLELFGYSHDEVIGRTTSFLRSSRTSDELYRQMWTSLEEKGEWKGEIYNRTKHGEEIPVWLSITSVYEDDKRVGYMGFEIDMRPQKKLEKRILQSERLAVIGKMAAKVAHEIRNPLSSISLNTELLEDEIRTEFGGLPEEAETLLKTIIGEVDRVANLSEEYLQFSRLPEAEITLCHIDDLVRDVVEFIEPEANTVGIQIITKIQEDIPPFPFDYQQIRRVLLNLYRNAIEAMKNGGLIRTEVKLLGEDVEIRIADTGDGIPDEYGKKIFDPFFTTKDLGTGLGLAITKQIITEHGGKISYESRLKSGTTFIIRLPLNASEEGQETRENQSVR